ncbi:MAG: Ni/Fe-hydrogenase, b-type cytochrome subunit [Thermodesulfovibrionales bacterium]|nr:Ni/Fe-hydrogenase, b-type cytochrome subunit [Thermodesulfovibrionales bacterium]
MLKRVYVWEFPVRLTHWLNVLSIIMLSITGYYIGNPFIHAHSSTQYIMGWMRFLHFVFAYVFTFSFIIRIYWAFAGNPYAGWRVFNPFSIEKIKDVFQILQFYLLLKKDVPPALKKPGHAALAAYAYFGLFILFIIQILTGFALYSQSHVGFIWKLAGGWLLTFFVDNTLRLYHHLIMWLIIAFVLIHVYISWFVDRAEKSGVISSIFSGYKVIED